MRPTTVMSQLAWSGLALTGAIFCGVGVFVLTRPDATPSPPRAQGNW